MEDETRNDSLKLKKTVLSGNGPLATYAKLRIAHAPGMPHRIQRKPLVSDSGMHHGTCVTHVPWCMSGSPTCSDGENVLGVPGACSTRNFAYLVRGPYIHSFAHELYIICAKLSQYCSIWNNYWISDTNALDKKSHILNWENVFQLSESYCELTGGVHFLCSSVVSQDLISMYDLYRTQQAGI